MFRTSHGCAVLNLGGREVVVVAGGQVGLDDDNNVEEANDNGRDNDNDDDYERCRSVTCQSQASLAVLILIKNRLVVRCFPQWSTSAWQRTITGRPCPLSRFQGSPKQALKKTRFRRSYSFPYLHFINAMQYIFHILRWKIVVVDCADDNDDCNVV